MNNFEIFCSWLVQMLQKEMLYRNVLNNVSFPHVHFLTQPQIDRSTAPAAYNNLALLRKNTSLNKTLLAF